MQEVILSNENNYQMKIDSKNLLHPLTSGLYFVTGLFEGKAITKKLIVQ